MRAYITNSLKFSQLIPTLLQSCARAKDVELPPKPAFNETAQSEWWAAREDVRTTIYDAGMHNRWDWGNSPEELARKAYSKSHVQYQGLVGSALFVKHLLC